MRSAPTKWRMHRAVACVALLGLSACGGEDAPVREDATASSDLLERSVSDDMLPFDTLRSEPPRAKPAKSEGKTAGASGDEASGEAPAEAAEEPEMAANPQATAPAPAAAGGSTPRPVGE